MLTYHLWKRNRTQLLWEEYVRSRRHIQVVYNTAYTEYDNSIFESLTSASHPHKSWSTLKTFLWREYLTSTYSHSVTFDPSEMAEVFAAVFYLKELDSNGGSDPDNMFLLFLKKTADLISPKLAKNFRVLLTFGGFPES